MLCIGKKLFEECSTLYKRTNIWKCRSSLKEVGKIDCWPVSSLCTLCNMIDIIESGIFGLFYKVGKMNDKWSISFMEGSNYRAMISIIHSNVYLATSISEDQKS